jgi:predicted transcriptional regulator
MKTVERNQARRMRRDEGRSIKEIARLLGVSTSSVSHWVRDVELTDAQHSALQARNRLHERQRLARAAMAAKARARRVAAQQEGRRRARSLGRRYVAGCMLYWAEGSRNRNRIVFTNSDPAMAQFFVEFIREFFDIDRERVRLTCNLLCRPRSSPARNRELLAQDARASKKLSLQVNRQPLLALQPEETKEQTSLRDVPDRRP